MADALCWHDAPLDLVTDAGVPVWATARGLLFRALTVAPGSSPEAARPEVRRYESVATTLGL